MSHWNKLPFTVIEANGYESWFYEFRQAKRFVTWLNRQGKTARIVFWND